MGFEWFCVRTEYRAEAKARRNIDAIELETYQPTCLRRIVHAGKTTIEQRALFSRYLFVRFDAADEAWKKIPGLHGVECLLSSTSGRPLPIPDHEMRRLDANIADHNRRVTTKKKSPFSRGQKLRVISGPFTSFDGVCEVPEPDRVEILLTIFGRQCRATLPENAIEAA